MEIAGFALNTKAEIISISAVDIFGELGFNTRDPCFYPYSHIIREKTIIPVLS